MYNNPFTYAPYMQQAATTAARGGLLSSIKAINWSGLLSNTQKTLGIINQTIPIVYQVKPIFNNAKTMFKIASTIKGDNDVGQSVKKAPPATTESIVNNTNYDNNDKPMFFI